MIHVTHYRWYRSPLRSIKDTLRSEPIPGFTVLPKGGKTIVRLIDEETGVLVGIGEAVCNKSDSYNKKTGTLVALERAVRSAIESIVSGKRPAIVRP